MKKQTALTDEQQAKIVEYRDRFFKQATSTELADRPRAEAAAKRMAEIGGVKVNDVVWVMFPQDGAEKYGAVWGSLRDSLMDSLWDSLSASLSTSLSTSLWGSLWDAGWSAFYIYARDVLSVQYDERSAELLHLYDEIGASCFELWIAPGVAILCERPEEYKIVDGRLVGVVWRQPAVVSAQKEKI